MLLLSPNRWVREGEVGEANEGTALLARRSRGTHRPLVCGYPRRSSVSQAKKGQASIPWDLVISLHRCLSRWQSDRGPGSPQVTVGAAAGCERSDSPRSRLTGQS